jgi:hypothetical protein
MDLSDAFTKRMGLCDALADFIHGLALGGVRRDGVTMRECPVVVRNHAAISQHNGIALNRLNLDEFAIDELLAGSVCLQQQLIASSAVLPSDSALKYDLAAASCSLLSGNSVTACIRSS